MSGCQLTDPFMEAVGEWLRSDPPLTELNIESNHFSGTGLKALSAALPSNHHLKALRLDNQKAGPFAADARAALLKAIDANDTLITVAYQFAVREERDAADKALGRNRARLRASTPKSADAKVSVDNPFLTRMEAVTSNKDSAAVFELKDANKTQFTNWTTEMQNKFFASKQTNKQTNTHAHAHTLLQKRTAYCIPPPNNATGQPPT
jgi:hypothetical protein